MTITPKPRRVVLLAALVALLFTSTATAQRAAADYSLAPFTGVYVLPTGVHMAVEVHDGELAVRPMGAAVPDVASDAQRALSQRADAILAGLAAHDTAPLRAAIAPHRRDRAVDIERLFALFAEGYGAIKSYRLLGTVSRGEGRIWTIAHVTFERGHEVIRLSWNGDQLATIQRGADSGSTFRQMASVRFTSAAGRNNITFNRRTDGVVESMTVEGPYGTVTAYKLDDLVATR